MGDECGGNPAAHQIARALAYRSARLAYDQTDFGEPARKHLEKSIFLLPVLSLRMLKTYERVFKQERRLERARRVRANPQKEQCLHCRTKAVYDVLTDFNLDEIPERNRLFLADMWKMHLKKYILLGVNVLVGQGQLATAISLLQTATKTESNASNDVVPSNAVSAVIFTRRSQLFSRPGEYAVTATAKCLQKKLATLERIQAGEENRDKAYTFGLPGKPRRRAPARNGQELVNRKVNNLLASVGISVGGLRLRIP